MANKNIEDLTELSVRQLPNRRSRLVAALPDLGEVVRGSVISQGRRCGKEDCRCARGELHGPYTYLSLRRGSGESRLIYVPASLSDDLRRRVAASDAVDVALAEISSVNVELLRRRKLT
jgi:hypothetical protein